MASLSIAPATAPALPGETDVQQRTDLLRDHQSQIRACHACVEAGFIPSAWPVFHGQADARIMIVGQAPAVRRTERPLPYSGASGRVLKEWLARAGFEPEDFYHRFYLTSLSKCFPGPSRSGQGDRPPSAAEIALCRPHLLGELAYVQPEVILPLGRLSASYFVDRRPLDQLVGQRFSYQGAAVLPLPHPSGVSRWLNDASHRALLDLALSELAAIRLRLDL